MEFQADLILYKSDSRVDDPTQLLEEIKKDNSKNRKGVPYYPKCGQRNKKGVGVAITYSEESTKYNTQFGEWPHMCAILRETADGKKEYTSGASLIDEGVVLTVAHYFR